MPKCIITTNSGEHTEIEADGFQLLPAEGFVILKRRVPNVTPGQPAVEQTVAIFYRPDKVLLDTADNAGSNNGSFTQG